MDATSQPNVPASSNTPQVFDFRKKDASEPAPCPMRLQRPVFFVGFMGAGKTSVARKVARLTNMASIDLDSYIERRSDKPIKEIFAESGEESFRALETATLRELAQGEPTLISCGGGIVLAPVNRDILKSSGFVVYLQVTADEAASRISDKSTRPLFGNPEQARRTIAERLPLYEDVADVCIDTSRRSTGALAHEVVDILKKEGVLWQPE